MTEVITNPEEQAEQGVAEEKLRQKFVYVDAPAIEAYRAEAKNKTLPAGVHPHLYTAAVQWTYENLKDSDDGSDYKDSEGGRPGIKPGGLSELVRQAVAKFVGYTGELSIKTTRVTSAEKQQADAFEGTAATVFMFARLQAMGDPDAEAQAKRNAFAVMMKRKEKLAPNMVLTEEKLEELWNEAE